MTHPIFGQLEYDENRGYVTKNTINFAGKETEVELVLALLYTQNNEIEEGHIKTHQALMQNWDSVVPRVLQSIMEYQNECWDDNDYTASFPKFQTHEDVLENLDCLYKNKNSHSWAGLFLQPKQWQARLCRHRLRQAGIEGMV